MDIRLDKILQLIVLFCSVVTINASTLRLVGGQTAPIHFGRFHASLQNLTGHHVCGGATISRYHIITAAHCVVGADPSYIKAVVGTTNLDIGGKQHDVASISIHEEYNASLRLNDIAIIRVKTPFNLRYVDVLNIYNKQLVEGDRVILTGFGAQEPNGVSSRNMYRLDLPVFDQATCRFAMRYTKEVTDSMFCTFTRIGEGMCHGDSGGPIIKYNQLVGVVSWGIPCAVGFPDVHTRVTPYIGWIRQHLKYANSIFFRNKNWSI